MATREQLSRVKQATVAIAATPAQPYSDKTKTPFKIVGSGFCIDKTGIVVTCTHVLESFLPRGASGKILDHGRHNPYRIEGMVRPHVIFFDTQTSSTSMLAISPPIGAVLACADVDVCVLRLRPHPRFADGYPHLEVESLSDLYEGMEIGTCGFPLGNELQDQVGTKTSSFTQGILSSIAPTAQCSEEVVKKFQLNIIATNGNSGGPVFSWATGKALGILQGGPKRDDGSALPGIALAEPIYFLFRTGMIEKIRNSSPV